MNFSKYHGLGNDFLVVDLRRPPSPADAERIQAPEMVKALCDRHFGVGADGVLAVLTADTADTPDSGSSHARMRVLNADGSEAEMCGNGLRCVVKHLFERDPAPRPPSLTIDTGAGPLKCDVETVATAAGGEIANAVTVNMGRPRLAREEIPMRASPSSNSAGNGAGDAGRCIAEPLTLAGRQFAITAVSMGNPHAIAFVDEQGPALRALAETVGPTIENHDWFPARTNAEFAHVHSPTEIELVVWERGCGITLACGTGACATAVAACLNGHAQPGTEIAVHLLGGTLAITVAEDYGTVWMRGPATHVYDATLDIDAMTQRIAASG